MVPVIDMESMVSCASPHDTWNYLTVGICSLFKPASIKNKANLRDLIAATGLVILLKFDPNHRFFVPCDLEY